MAGRLAAKLPLLLAQAFQNVAVPHLGALEGDAAGFQGAFQAQIAHLRAHHAALEAPAQKAGLGDDVEQFVAVRQVPFGIHHHHPVAVAVEGDAGVRADFAHLVRDGLRMRGAVAGVDVGAVRSNANRRNVRAQLGEHLGRHGVGGAVGAVHHQLQAAQMQAALYGALAELDVAAARVVDAERPAQVPRTHGPQRLRHLLLDGALAGVRQLVAFGIEDLDAVVVEGVVRGADDDAGVRAQGAGEIGDGRRRDGAKQVHVHAGRDEPRLQQRFDHVAGDAGVLADQHQRRSAGGEHLADGPAQAQARFRRDRGLPHAATNAVRAEQALRCWLCFAHFALGGYRAAGRPRSRFSVLPPGRRWAAGPGVPTSPRRRRARWLPGVLRLAAGRRPPPPVGACRP